MFQRSGFKFKRKPSNTELEKMKSNPLFNMMKKQEMLLLEKQEKKIIAQEDEQANKVLDELDDFVSGREFLQLLREPTVSQNLDSNEPVEESRKIENNYDYDEDEDSDTYEEGEVPNWYETKLRKKKREMESRLRFLGNTAAYISEPARDHVDRTVSDHNTVYCQYEEPRHPKFKKPWANFWKFDCIPKCKQNNPPNHIHERSCRYYELEHETTKVTCKTESLLEEEYPQHIMNAVEEFEVFINELEFEKIKTNKMDEEQIWLHLQIKLDENNNILMIASGKHIYYFKNRMEKYFKRNEKLMPIKAFWFIDRRVKQPNPTFIFGDIGAKQQINSLSIEFTAKALLCFNFIHIDLLKRTLLPFLTLTQSTHLVEIGCGVGLLSNMLAQKCAKVIGIDTSEGPLIVAREISRANKIFNTNFTSASPTKIFDTLTAHLKAVRCVVIIKQDSVFFKNRQTMKQLKDLPSLFKVVIYGPFKEMKQCCGPIAELTSAHDNSSEAFNPTQGCMVDRSPSSIEEFDIVLSFERASLIEDKDAPNLSSDLQPKKREIPTQNNLKYSENFTIDRNVIINTDPDLLAGCSSSYHENLVRNPKYNIVQNILSAKPIIKTESQNGCPLKNAQRHSNKIFPLEQIKQESIYNSEYKNNIVEMKSESYENKKSEEYQFNMPFKKENPLRGPIKNESHFDEKAKTVPINNMDEFQSMATPVADRYQSRNYDFQDKMNNFGDYTIDKKSSFINMPPTINNNVNSNMDNGEGNVLVENFKFSQNPLSSPASPDNKIVNIKEEVQSPMNLNNMNFKNESEMSNSADVDNIHRRIKEEIKSPTSPDSRNIKIKSEISTPASPDNRNVELKKELQSPSSPDNRYIKVKKEFSSPASPDNRYIRVKEELQSPSSPDNTNFNVKQECMSPASIVFSDIENGREIEQIAATYSDSNEHQFKIPEIERLKTEDILANSKIKKENLESQIASNTINENLINIKQEPISNFEDVNSSHLESPASPDAQGNYIKREQNYDSKKKIKKEKVDKAEKDSIDAENLHQMDVIVLCEMKKKLKEEIEAADAEDAEKNKNAGKRGVVKEERVQNSRKPEREKNPTRDEKYNSRKYRSRSRSQSRRRSRSQSRRQSRSRSRSQNRRRRRSRSRSQSRSPNSSRSHSIRKDTYSSRDRDSSHRRGDRYESKYKRKDKSYSSEYEKDRSSSYDNERKRRKL